MQAGEKLSFIEPFTEERKVDDSEHAKLLIGMHEICSTLLNKYPKSIQTTHRLDLDDNEIVLVYEGSFKIDFDDSSYLHVVIFGHNNEVGVKDLGISVIEHSEEGIFCGGYMYTLYKDGVLRDTCHPEIIEDKLDPDTTHFSLLGFYETQDELDMLEQSQFEDEQELAKDIKKRNDENREFEEFERQMGFNRQSPSVEELKDLNILLQDAVPFSPPA